MALTSPSNLFSPDAGDGYALVTDLAAMQDSVQTALNTKVRTSTDYLWANAAARTAQTEMIAGEVGYQTDPDTAYRYDGSLWFIAGNNVRLQTDTINSVITVLTQIGKGKIAGTGVTTLNEAVTFPVAFAGVPVVIVTYCGYRNPIGAFNDVGLTNSGTALVAAAQNKSTTGFSAYLENPTGGNLGSSDWYYNWIAIGVPA